MLSLVLDECHGAVTEAKKQDQIEALEDRHG
jgi:hypothetical protein